MNAQHKLGVLLSVVTAALVTAALAPTARAAGEPARWSAGAEAIWLGIPKGHIGLLPSNGGYALTGALVGRYELSAHFALDAGIGLPHPALGFGGWLTFETFGRVLGSDDGLALLLFQQLGPELGYAGADYFARAHDSFVGYGYTAAGPLVFALRFPTGVALRVRPAPIDVYLQAVPIVAFTPAVEPLYDVTLGVRARF